MHRTKSCLLIAPLSFYSYSEYLRSELTQIGYEVSLSNDEYPANTWGKIMGKLKIPILLKQTHLHISRHFLKDKNYDLTIIIKGRGMSRSLIRDIKANCPLVIGYTFDSLKYHPAPKNWLRETDAFFTFDYRDAEDQHLNIIELFSSLPAKKETNKEKYEISGIARNHSKRLSFIYQVMKSLPYGNNFIYIYEQNVITFLQNFFRNPILYIKYWKYIFFKPLSFEKYKEVLHNSNFVIDFAHPDQSGITIRCYEALSSGTKIITNNPYIFRDRHFNTANTILIKNKKDFSLLSEKYNAIKNSQTEFYNRSINIFIKDLLQKSGSGRKLD